MHILILAVGSQGDVQPYVALGAGLRAAGHVVTLATSGRFGALVTEAGLRHAVLQADFLQLADTPEGKRALAGGNPFKLLKRVEPMIRSMLDECLGAAEGADAIIYHPKALAGRHIAEAHGIPGVLAHPVPLFSPTRVFPSLLLPFADLGPWFNQRSHSAFVNLTLSFYRSMIGRWRSGTLGLPAAWDELSLFGKPLPRLYGFSEHVLPQPADWDKSSFASGFWFYDRPAAWAPPAELVRFLESGPPSVYIGFGSMAAADAERKAALAIAALERAGARGILARGAGGLVTANPPSSVLFIDSVPHDWLFERVAAVVHHGGAGTTAAGLRAGLPTVICPFFGDQPFWGRRVATLGVGPQPIPQKRLTVDNLAQALTTVLHDAEMRRRAVSLGERIRAEDGVGRAVAWIEERVGVTIMQIED